MPIQKIRIRGFQKHAKFDLELDPYVTTVLGNTGSGKSSILRSIRWICFNRPLGDRFVRWGSKKTAGQLVVDGKKVSRIKGKGINRYEIDGSPYEAAGSGVPDTVTKILNVGEENFQGQRDNPFWFMKTGGEVGKELNKIVNLDLIDHTMANLASEVKKSKSTVEASEERLKEAESRKESLSWVPEANAALEEIERLEEAWSETRRKRSRIKDLCKEAQESLRTKGMASRAILIGKKAIQKGRELLKVQSERTKLESWVSNRKEMEAGLCQEKKKLTELKKELKEKFGNRCPLCQKPKD